VRRRIGDVLMRGFPDTSDVPPPWSAVNKILCDWLHRGQNWDLPSVLAAMDLPGLDVGRVMATVAKYEREYREKVLPSVRDGR
jgi:hypothetical protein